LTPIDRPAKVKQLTQRSPGSGRVGCDRIMDKYICIHGHFYQPPRENPWLESLEVQDSASPYHDWNERICMECYAPNSAARILDGSGKIDEITNNYSKISFNFGPTLLSWLQDKMPEIHEAILAADKLSLQRYGGHGSALGQVYNHMILPLANARDRYTQVLWGVRDFQHRFGRAPEGMWLSETAADTPSLETLAELGIRFTILSPYQASRVKEIGKRNSRDVNGAQIDPSRPYLMRLPSGRSITLFFYDGSVSRAIAFESLLSSGESLANRLMSAFNDRRQGDQLVHIATDGESYGHHHRHGEMALAYALSYIENKNLAKLTNYGQYLETHPPTQEVQIHEKSAWSCAHGVGRWMNDCGCNSGGHPGWNQGWRAPLRMALDWLRDELAPLFENKGKELLRDPWGARNEYISIILDRSSESRERFFAAQASRELTENEKTTVLKLMELQRHAMLMYTSCGWFFDELSGIETVQVVQYAARALQLAQQLFERDLEPEFLNRLEHAKSNIPEHGDGKRIYEKFVKPAMIDWAKAEAHYAISSLFHQYGEKTRIFSFSFEDEHRQFLTAGKTKLAVGRTRIHSEITEETHELSYGVLYLGEHNLTGAVRRFDSADAYEAMFHDVKASFDAADYPETIRRIDRHFGGTPCSLTSLFKDEQRRILKEILASTHEDLEQRFRLITERYTPLMKFLQSVGAPLPVALDTAREYVLREDIRHQLDADPLDFAQLRNLIEEARSRNGHVLDARISFVVKNRMERLINDVAANPAEVDRINVLDQLAQLVMPLPLGLNLWKVQNLYWSLLQHTAVEEPGRAAAGQDAEKLWMDRFLKLGATLGFAHKNVVLPEMASKIAA
jgi:alpha-amylase/alpha-mannosidase (GH57 family)